MTTSACAGAGSAGFGRLGGGAGRRRGRSGVIGDGRLGRGPAAIGLGGRQRLAQRGQFGRRRLDLGRDAASAGLGGGVSARVGAGRGRASGAGSDRGGRRLRRRHGDRRRRDHDRRRGRRRLRAQRRATRRRRDAARARSDAGWRPAAAPPEASSALAALAAIRAIGGAAMNLRLDDEIVRAADHQQMLDIVAPHDDELALVIKREHIDHAQPRRAVARRAGNPQAMREDQPVNAENDAENHQQNTARRARTAPRGCRPMQDYLTIAT